LELSAGRLQPERFRHPVGCYRSPLPYLTSHRIDNTK